MATEVATEEATDVESEAVAEAAVEVAAEAAIEAASEAAEVETEVASEEAEAVAAASAAVEEVIIHIIEHNLGFDQGPPEYVQEIAEFSHECEGLLIATMTTEQVPLLMRSIYLQNKNKIGKMDDIFGAINSGGIAIKPDEGIKADGFKAGDKVRNC